ncbi:uncharacterized protein LOC134928712 [Pseudophryne corroboree]|uniref:uncharacterized protein LOC134928712 n=1 Tax=Pseudophryne corroboree TaxID=495146 RepID=UPI0030817339
MVQEASVGYNDERKVQISFPVVEKKNDKVGVFGTGAWVFGTDADWRQIKQGIQKTCLEAGYRQGFLDQLAARRRGNRPAHARHFLDCGDAETGGAGRGSQVDRDARCCERGKGGSLLTGTAIRAVHLYCEKRLQAPTQQKGSSSTYTSDAAHIGGKAGPLLTERLSPTCHLSSLTHSWLITLHHFHCTGDMETEKTKRKRQNVGMTASKASN